MSDMVILGFKAEYTKDGRQVDWVEIAPSGEAFERTHTWHRVKDLMPPESVDDVRANSPAYKVLQARWAQIGPRYQAWLKGQELPEEGTALAAWAGVTPEQAAVLRGMGLRTVEAVRDMSESAIVRLPFPDARRLPQLARDFLSSKGEAEKDAIIADMAERMKAMEQMILEQRAAVAEPEKRGPGRPRKQEEAA